MGYSTRPGGQGLGMSTLWHIVTRMHGGEIEAVWEEAEDGESNKATFRIKLPATQRRKGPAKIRELESIIESNKAVDSLI